MRLNGQTYDRVWSLGQWCVTALLLKKAGLRSASGPVDWNGPVPGIVNDVALYVGHVLTRFANFFRKENLRRVGENAAEGKIHYDDIAGGLNSRHDFGVQEPFDAAYARARAKYDRRIARFLAQLEVPGKYLFVHCLGEGRADRTATLAAWARFRTRYPASRLDLLVFETEPRAAVLRWDRPVEGVSFVTGDFYDPTRHDAVIGNERLFLSVLRKVGVRGKFRNLVWQRIHSFKRRLSRRRGRR